MNKIFLGVLSVVFLLDFNIDAQQSWFLQNTETDQTVNDITFANLNTGYAVCNGGIFLKTIDGGNNWYQIQGPFNSDLRKVKFFDSMTGLVFSGQGTYKTTNGGLGWELVNIIGTIPGCEIADGNTIYASYRDEQYYGILKSTNRGTGWEGVYPISGLVAGFSFINASSGFAVAFHFGSGYSYLGLYKTTDAAIHWNSDYSVTSNLPNRNPASIFFPSLDTGYFTGKGGNTNTIFRYLRGNIYSYAVTNFQHAVFFINGKTGWTAGENGSVYRTSNAGINWNISPTPITVDLLDIMFINNFTGWAAGENGVIMKTTNGGIPVSIQNINQEIPKDFKLFQNYPNPFNPISKIKFQIAKLTDAKLVIFDVLGREVATLVNEQFQPGTYEVEWDAADYPNGVYYYKLIIDEYTETKKMVLIK